MAREVSATTVYPDLRWTPGYALIRTLTLLLVSGGGSTNKVVFCLLPDAHPQEAASEGSDSDSSSAEGMKRGTSWIKSFGRRRRRGSGASRSRSKSKRRAGRDGGGSSDDSGDGPLTSGSSEAGEEGEEEDGDGGLLLGKRAR